MTDGETMKLDDITTIGVVGAGQMGRGIAQVCATAGYRVLLHRSFAAKNAAQDDKA